MEETVKKHEPVTSQETVKKQQEPVIETVTSFKPVRKHSEKQMANSILLGKNNVEFKRKKKERLLQELQDRTSSQAKPDQQSKSDVATIEEIEEPVKQDRTSLQAKPGQTAIYIGLGIVAIIGCGVYCWYSRKAQSLTAKADTSKADTAKAVETVKSGIIDME